MARFDPDRVRASRIERALRVVREALAERDAVAFVHAGDDAASAVFGAEAVVVTADRAVGLVVDPTDADAADADPESSGGDGDCTLRRVDDPAEAVVRLARELTPGPTGTALTPRAVRHDTALFLERAGFDVASTAADADARATKTPAERDALRRLGSAVEGAVDRTVDRLAADDWPAGVDTEAEIRDSDGDADAGPTTTRLSRAVAVELARGGVDPADTRVRGVDGRVVPGRPVVVDCRPRGPDGSRLRAAWTLVVDGDGGWERRAHVALEAAHRAGRGRLTAALDDETETVGSIAGEVRAELTAYGFEEPTVTVHGVGLSVRESPRDGDRIESGQAVVVAASVTRAADGTASADRRTDRVTRAETLLLDERGGVERLVSLPSSLSP
ncbi:M24 family metallopeptidase [Salinigranum marinum]|uniref:M24 family metallopeptidase n=1 Tax=Salinigranum marinum TaxID=1515595 RepID=UPI002989DEF3|nr:M24 family metallopeptidase [Salinigranum marinum]